MGKNIETRTQWNIVLFNPHNKTEIGIITMFSFYKWLKLNIESLSSLFQIITYLGSGLGLELISTSLKSQGSCS